jgi:hypothetical protein
MIQTCHVVIDERFRAYHAEGSSVWMLDDSRLPSLRPGEAYGDWTRGVTRRNTAADFGRWVTNQERNSGGSAEGRALLCNFEHLINWNTLQATEGMRVVCELASDAGFGSVWVYADFAARNAAIMEMIDGLIQPANYRVPMISRKSIPMLHPKEHGEQETIQRLYDLLLSLIHI